MKFKESLVPGVLLRRYKRFLADMKLSDGTVVTAHSSNTGSMMQVSEPGSPVMLSEVDNPHRKTRYEWEMILVNDMWAGINTGMPNILLKEGFESGIIHQFHGYNTIRMEVPQGANYRADAVLTGKKGTMFIEAKNVTLVENRCAIFPDAVTSRGFKHLEKLEEMIKIGYKAALFFLSQRMDAECVGTASHIDPRYAERLAAAVQAGVEVIAWRAKITPEFITLDSELPFVG